MKWLQDNLLKIGVLIYSVFSLAMLWGYALSGFEYYELFRIWYSITGVIALVTIILTIIFLLKGVRINHIRNKIKKDKERKK